MNEITNDFYKHHQFYRILGVERHTKIEDIEKRAKLLMSSLPSGSQQYKVVETATKCLTTWMLRKFYDTDGDWDPRTQLRASESQRHDWGYMRDPEDMEPEHMNPRNKVRLSKKQLDLLASMKDEHGAASGKLSTHNQFGSASTWNPYLI